MTVKLPESDGFIVRRIRPIYADDIIRPASRIVQVHWSRLGPFKSVQVDL